ncbi:MAG: DUF2493 domain-containing protein [Gammaproteobacteria bacterium]|nr:DUF2493 domain-containing protein [Gammaproteobacteria bacterium]
MDNALTQCPWINFISVVVSGTAKGADKLGEQWAKQRNLIIEKYPADWEKYGKKAGPIRNQLMAENADGLIALWDNKSRGTKSMIDSAKNCGLRIFIFDFKNNSLTHINPTKAIGQKWEQAEERAGIKEHDAGLMRSEAERLAGAAVAAEFKTSNP